MKHILLYFFICFSTCLVAQNYSMTFVSNDEYGISNFNNRDTNPEVSVFPNPTSDFITIEDKNEVVSTATIFNLLGKEVGTFNVNGLQRYDMSHLFNGIYLVQLKDKEGLILQTIRIKKI